MSNFPGKVKLLSKLIGLGTAGLLMGTAGAYAAGESQGQSQSATGTQQHNQQVDAPQFSDVDRDGDQKLVWTEIYAVYDDEIDSAGLREQDVMNQYDQDRNASLNSEEYLVFVAAIANLPGSELSQTQGQSQPQGQNQNQIQSDQQVMTEGQQQQQNQQQQDQDVAASGADPGSAEYYDEQDSDAVSEEFEQDSDTVAQSDIVQEQQQVQEQDMEQQGMEQQDIEQQQAQTDSSQQDMESAQQEQMAGDQQTRQEEALAGTEQGEVQRQAPQSQQEPAQQGASAQPEQAESSTTTIIAITDVPDLNAEDLADREVVNLNGEQIGEVEDVVLGADGAITGLVVGVGGFWDIGDKDVFASANELRVSGEQILWETTLDEDSLKELPEYEAPEVSDIE